MRLLIIICSIAFILILTTFDHVERGEIIVVESFFTGELSYYKDPGIVWKGFGKTVYRFKFHDEFEFYRDFKEKSKILI